MDPEKILPRKNVPTISEQLPKRYKHIRNSGIVDVYENLGIDKLKSEHFPQLTDYPSEKVVPFEFRVLGSHTYPLLVADVFGEH